MPTTVNGVGTTYYGHGNVQVRTGVCRSCGHTGRLESYDTRLWFVIIFIPIIPLGRKRIIDQCPNCQRHFVAGKDQFEMSRQLGVSAVQEQYRERPSPETALEAHATLLAFHDHGGAESFRQDVLQRFPESGELRAGLASHMEQVGRYGDAQALYDQAWELRPDLPLVRDAMARRRIFEGKLDEARELLDFQLLPGAGQIHSLAALDQLAFAYQKQGRHEESLEVCQHLLTELPPAAQHYQFRKFVKVSERALGRTESILPKPQGGWLGLLNFKNSAHPPWKKWTATASVIAALVLMGLLINNDYKRRHQTVHVVNGFPEPATVQIDNATPTVIAGRGQVTLAEGPHHVKITRPIQDELDINVQSSFFGRWWNQPAWVLNVGGRSVLCEWQVFYAVAAPPAIPRLIANQKFTAIPHVDYVFTDPPRQLQVDNREQQVVKTHLEVLQAKPDDVIPELAKTSTETALAFAESQLTYYPDDLKLLKSYVDLGSQCKQEKRVENYLKAGCSRRPIEVNWHRSYQDLLEASQRDAELIAEYGELLKSDPKNGTLLYLCGRVEPDAVKAQALFFESTEADKKLPWPWYAISTFAASSADWDTAAKAMENARERKMDPDVLSGLRHNIRLAIGDRKQLEQEYRAEIQAQPHDPRPLLCLCDVLAVTDQPDAAKQALSQWEASIPPMQRTPEMQPFLTAIRQTVLYQLGDIEALKTTTSLPPSQSFAQIRAEALLMTGDAVTVAQDASLADAWKDAWSTLGLSVALSLQGHDAEAKDWRQRACQEMDKGGQDDRRSAALLRSEVPPPLDKVRGVTHSIHHQLRLLAALALRFPELRAEYATEISKLNISRSPPYHLVKQAGQPSAAQ